MKRQRLWDKYEAVILLEAYIEVYKGNIDVKQAISNVSWVLRKKALMEGEDIDDKFRNEAGIKFQMYSMESAYKGYTVRMPATKLFLKVVEIRKNDKSQYDQMLLKARKIITDKEHLGEQFFNDVQVRKSDSVISVCRENNISEELMGKYKKILKLKFAKGYRIESNIELKKFEKAFKEEFGEEIEQDTDTIKKVIKLCGVEYEGKVYLPDTMLSSKKKEQVLTYIDEIFSAGKEVVYYSALFSECVEILEGEHIYTPEMLKTYLEYVVPNQYFFKRQYLSMSQKVNINPFEEIKKYLVERGEAVKVDEICNALKHLPEKKITQILGTNREFARNSKGVYFYADLVVLTDDQLNKISKLIQKDIDHWGYAIGSEIINNVYLKYPEIFESYTTFSILGLRNVLAYKLKNKYTFNNNVISTLGERISMTDIYANFTRRHKYFTVAELELLKTETGSGMIYFEPVYRNSLRISQNEFVDFESVHFDIAQTDSAIDRYLSGDYISISEIETFGMFPYAGYSWNSFLLEGYVLNFSKNYKLINNGFNVSSCAGAIVRKNVEINDIEELLIHVLAESSCELYAEEALNYLYKKGYIARRYYPKLEKILTDAKVLRLKKG